MKIHFGRLIYIDIMSVKMAEAIWKHIKINVLFSTKTNSLAWAENL